MGGGGTNMHWVLTRGRTLNPISNLQLFPSGSLLLLFQSYRHETQISERLKDWSDVMWMEQAMFYLFSMLPHREPDCLPNSRWCPSCPILWFPASPKALCCHEKSAVQPQVWAVEAPQQFWKESTFSLLTAFCFPALCIFHTGVECCGLWYPASLNTIAMASSWNKWWPMWA